MQLWLRRAAVRPLGLLVALPLAAQTPFPADRTTDLREDGATYTVEGRVKIPRNVSITALRQMTVRGNGTDSVLELSGALKLKAATGGKIKLIDVWLELTPDCKELVLSHVQFFGRGGIRPAPDGPADTKIFMEYTDFLERATLTLEMTGGELDIQSSRMTTTATIRGIPRSEKSNSKLDVMILGCTGREQGLLDGLVIESAKSVLVRNCDIAGSESRFVDNEKLDFDGNNARCRALEFRQTTFGGFKRTKVHNTDFTTPRVLFHAPTDGDKAERLKLDHCYFDGMEDPATIKERLIEDAERDPENGVLIQFSRISPTPLGLARPG